MCKPNQNKKVQGKDAEASRSGVVLTVTAVAKCFSAQPHFHTAQWLINSHVSHTELIMRVAANYSCIVEGKNKMSGRICAVVSCRA